MPDTVPSLSIMDADEVNLVAVLYALRDGEMRAREICETGVETKYQDQIDRNTDRRAANALGRIASEGCAKFEGEKEVASEYRLAKERRYSMYALHPDTAAQIIQAIEFLIERSGPRLRFPVRARQFEPKTVRNKRDA